MIANRLQSIWENGIPLPDAFEHFSNDNPILIKNHSEGIDIRPGQSEIEYIKNISKSFSALINTCADITSIPRRKRDWVIGELSQKRLMAIGYRASNNASIELSIIPDVLFKPDFIDWKQSSIAGLNLHYVDVRISEYKKFNHPKNPEKPIGRPNNKTSIWQLIKSIGLQELQEKHGNNKTAIANEIFQVGRLRMPDQFSNFNPTAQTIIRHYNSYLNSNSEH